MITSPTIIINNKYDKVGMGGNTTASDDNELTNNDLTTLLHTE